MSSASGLKYADPAEVPGLSANTFLAEAGPTSNTPTRFRSAGAAGSSKPGSHTNRTSLEPPQSRAPTETVAGRDGRNSGVAPDRTAGTNPNATLATVTSPTTRGPGRTFRPAIIARLPTLRRAGSTAPLPPTRAHHDSIRIQIVCANRIAASRELARDFSVWGVPYRHFGDTHMGMFAAFFWISFPSSRQSPVAMPFTATSRAAGSECRTRRRSSRRPRC